MNRRKSQNLTIASRLQREKLNLMLLLRDFQNPACMVKNGTWCTRSCKWELPGFHSYWLTQIKRLRLKGSSMAQVGIVKIKKENPSCLSFRKLMLILECILLWWDFTLIWHPETELWLLSCFPFDCRGFKFLTHLISNFVEEWKFCFLPSFPRLPPFFSNVNYYSASQKQTSGY